MDTIACALARGVHPGVRAALAAATTMRTRLHRTLASLASLASAVAMGTRGHAQQPPAARTAQADPVADHRSTSAEDLAAIQRRSLLDHAGAFTSLTEPRPGAVRVEIEPVAAGFFVLQTAVVGHRTETYDGVASTYERMRRRRVCVTPCTLYLPPGPTDLTVLPLEHRTDEVLHFDTPIDGGRVRVHGYDEPMAQWGMLDGALGGLSIFGGLLWIVLETGSPATDPTAHTDLMWSAGGLAIAGGLQAVAGIVLASLAPTRLLGVAPLHRRGSRVAFVGASLAPDAAQHGAHAALTFAF